MAIMNKVKTLALTAFVSAMASAPAWANKAVNQSQNVRTLADNIVLAIMVAAFGVGIVILMYTAWNVGKDYIWAGRQQEEKMSIGKIFIGVILGSLLAAPSATFIFGQSLSVGDTDAVEFSKDDFQRPSTD